MSSIGVWIFAGIAPSDSHFENSNISFDEGKLDDIVTILTKAINKTKGLKRENPTFF